MRTRPLGQSGIQASVIGLGTWAIGGWMWGGTEEADAIKTIHTAIDQGMNLIDTAPAYGFGQSEQIIGKAIKGKRDKVVIATKCGLVWDTTQGELFFTSSEDAITQGTGQYNVHRYLGPQSIIREIEGSLKRLGTDHIDLYQTHWQDPTTPIEDTMACLMQLKRQGKIRAIGVSNATPAQMAVYRDIGALDTAQEKFSMLDRGIAEDKLPYCLHHGIAVLSYSTLAMGLLTGKITPDRKFAENDLRRGHARFTHDNIQHVLDMLQEFKPIAARHDCTMAQLVIAWTIAQPGITHALCGARRPDQVRDNAKAASVELNDDEVLEMTHVIESHASALT